MKKLVFLLVLFLLVYLPITAYAHPGKTDSKGGHYDSDTGDYHYHHGYSAHSHYDMDGDGDIDCPYNFKDKTDHSPSSNSGITSGPNATTNASPYAKNSQGTDSSALVATVIGIMMILGLLSSFVSKKVGMIFVGIACMVFFVLMFVFGIADFLR